MSAQAQKSSRADSLLRVLSAATADTARVNILLTLSDIYKSDTITKKFYYANEALALSEKIGWERGKMDAEYRIADCYNDILAYKDAMVHFKTSLAIARKLKEIYLEAYCLQLLFHVYYHMPDLPNALAVQRELVDLKVKMGEPHQISDQRIALAQCLSDNDKTAEALESLAQDITFAREHFAGSEQMNAEANILNTQALVYIRRAEYANALGSLRKAITLTHKTGNRSTETYLNSTFCDVFARSGPVDSAIFYCERTLKMGAGIDDISLMQQYSKTLGTLYEKANRSADALRCYKIADSLTNVIGNAQKLLDRSMQVARTNLEQQAAHTGQERRAFEAVKRNQRTALLASITTLLALVVLTVFIYRNLKQKQRANKTISMQAASLQQQNEVIDKALKEKEMLLKETHHRVKNNLQLISSLLELQAANLADGSAKDALHRAQDRVLSIATVHSKLYGSTEDEMIDLSAFVNDLFARLDRAFSHEQKAVGLDNRIPATLLPLNTIVLLGIILNELITNSFKHAFADLEQPEIRISLKSAEGMYTLIYLDNGPGLPQGRFEADGSSLGLYLVRRLAKQLKGTAAYKYDAGSTFTIIFPYAAN